MSLSLLPGVTAAAAARTAGTWGSAEEVPGTAALNQGTTSGFGDASTQSVSCATAGNCGIGGYYLDGSDHYQAFVDNQVGGGWETAMEVPGTAALNAGGAGAVTTVSCAAPGDCTAGGYYTDDSGLRQAFVADETGGTWGTAEEVPGTAVLNAGGKAEVTSLSCASAGDCTAGGYYAESSGDWRPFLAAEVAGAWHTAQRVRGIAALSAGGNAVINAVSCATAGNCAAGGFYTDAAPHQQAFVVVKAKGTWGTAQEAPGTAALNAGGTAAVTTMSCASAGDCGAGGYYIDGSSHEQAFVATEADGTWKTALKVPGLGPLNEGGNAATLSVSCASAGYCSAGGVTTGFIGIQIAFVVGERKGTWDRAEQVPGILALGTGNAEVATVSCASAGNCSAGGSYNDSGSQEGFVVDETGGTWGNAEAVPGLEALNTNRNTGVGTLSCGSAGNCTAGGSYSDIRTGGQAFVVSEASGG